MSVEKRNSIEAKYTEFFNYLQALENKLKQSSSLDKINLLMKISNTKTTMINLMVEEVMDLKADLNSLITASPQNNSIRADARRFSNSEKIKAAHFYKNGLPIPEIRVAIGARSEYTTRTIIRRGLELIEKEENNKK